MPPSDRPPESVSPATSRRAFLSAVGGVATALAGCGRLATRRPAPIDCRPLDSPWPTVRATPGRTGVSSTADLPAADATFESLMDRGDPARGGIDSPPVVAEGIAYATSYTGHVVARGAREWTAELDAQGFYTPAITCGTVYAQTGGGIVALDARTGEHRWHVGNRAKANVVNVSPTARDGTIYAGPAGKIAALDAGTGEFEWIRELPDATPLGLAVADAGVVAAVALDHEHNAGALVGLDLDGNERWRTRFDVVRADAAGPAVAGDRAYFATERTLAAVDVADGGVVWREPVGRGFADGLAVHDGLVFTPDGADDRMYAVAADDGSVQWSKRVGNTLVPPAVVDGLVVAGVHGDRFFAGETSRGFYALDPSTGDVERRWGTDAVNDFAVGDGRICFTWGHAVCALS